MGLSIVTCLTGIPNIREYGGNNEPNDRRMTLKAFQIWNVTVEENWLRIFLVPPTTVGAANGRRCPAPARPATPH